MTLMRAGLRLDIANIQLALVGLAISGAVSAQVAVPPELQGWEGWALHDHETHRCPWLVTGSPADDARICAWPAGLELQVDAHGGRFSQRWQAAAETWLPLPGSREYWPEGVTLDGKPAAVVMRDGAPALHVAAGTAAVTAVFHWDRRPEVLPLPALISLIELTVDGARIPAPQRNAAGVVLGAQTVARQDDHVELRVFRLLDDALPARLTTELHLTVAGEAREIRLPAVLPPGFVPTAIASVLPARLDPDDTLHVQGRPGNFTLLLEARGPSPVTEVRLGERAAPWPAQEVWSFRSEERLRTVAVEGIAPTDPAQADVPGQWRALPAYRLDSHATLRLVERTRGMSTQNDNALELRRTAWLDFAGRSYTLVDTVSGDMRQGWRLDMAAPYVLQSAWTTSDRGGKPLLITAGTTPGLTGVELREPQIDLQTISQVRRVSAALPASGWRTRFTRVSGELIVAPGYRLLAALGPDSAPQAWLERWRLVDIFGVLLIATVAWRALGVRTAAVALAALVLTYQESDAPTWLWLNLLVALALLRAAPEGRLKRWVCVYRGLAVAALLVTLVPFAITQARLALYPQLEALGVMARPPEPLMKEAAALQEKRSSLTAGNVGALGGVRERAPAPHAFGRLASPPVSSAITTLNAPVQEVVVTGSRASGAEEMRYEPGALVQAGPGVPSWAYHVYPYSWSGPVEANATARFIISPPWLTRLWRVLGLALTALLLFELTGSALRTLPAWWRARMPRGVAVALLGLCAVIEAPRAAHAASTPDPRILSELQTRLLENPKCLPTCAEVLSATVAVEGTRLSILMEVSALDRVGIPLPGAEPSWSPDLVQIDGAPAGGVYRNDSGTRYAVLNPGRHAVRIDGALGATDALSLAFLLPPRVIDVNAPGWDSGGVSERHLVSGALELARRRVVTEGARSSARQEEFPPFVSIERLLHLGHDWTIATTVSRIAPRSAAFSVSVPLLPNEAVTTPGLTARGGMLTLGIGAGELSQQFASSLPPSETLELVAPPEGAGSEHWRFNVGPNWHVDFSGTPAVMPGEGAAPVWLFEYYPRPGEHLTLRATRPAATAGGTLAFDQVQLESEVGKRSSDSTLVLGYRSTQGGSQTLRLPAEARVTQVLSDGQPIAMRPEQGVLTLAASPGSHSWSIDWETPVGARLITHAPVATLGAPASNLQLTLRLPQDRWVLYAFGGGVGPSILYWGELVLFVVIAWLIGRSGLTPLATREWLLLGLGLSTLSWTVFAAFLAFVAVFEWRVRHAPLADTRGYNLLQIGCALLAAIAIAAVVSAVPQGLLARPDMRILPADEPGALRWFVDQASGDLPSPAVLSVSLWWYKLAMLAWALWLSFALTRWVRWAWQVLVRDGLWHTAPLRPSPLPPVPAAEPGASQT